MTAPDLQQTWERVLGDLRLQTAPDQFRTWFQGTRLLSAEGDAYVVATDNAMTLPMLSKYSPLIARTLQSQVGRPVDVQIVVRHTETETAPPPLRLRPPPLNRVPRARSPGPTPARMPPTSPRYSFQTFVVGSHNRLAHAVCVAAAEKPGQAHNPVFIYSGVGLGKTHLLHAVGHAALQHDFRVIYASSETFTNEFIESIHRGRGEDFRAKYRQTDLLLIDDIQFIAGKEGTQEEFFHTFNTVHEAGGQIVISSDRHPRAIATLEERLRSRFVWGLIADIQEPDLETRTAILRSKLANGAVENRREVPDEVLDFLAASIPSNIRELLGALNRVLVYADLTGAPITVGLASTALQSVLEAMGSRSVTPAVVIDAVCRSSGVSRAELEGRQRDRRVVLPRQVAMFLLREMTGLSLSEIGGLLGNRDHTTVLHNCEKVATELHKDHRVKSEVNAARELLAAGVR